MAQIDCTMDKLKFPNVASFQRTYGTRKMANGGSLTTEEFNQNLFLPFDNDRPIIISENSSTSVIEYPAKFLMNTPNVTLTLGNGAYSGLEISVLVTVQGANKVTIAHGQTSDVVLGDSNRIYKYMWTGSFWFCSSIPTKGTVVSAKVVGTCETEGNEEEKDIYLTDYVDTVLPAEMTVHFTNANTFGDTTATVPTHPVCNIYNSNNVLLATLDICDSRGHFAGKGCWNDGDDMDFKVSGNKIRITNSDVRQASENYAIKADGSFVYPSRIDWTNRITFTTAEWVATQRVWVECMVGGNGQYQVYIDGVECSTYDTINNVVYRCFSGIVEKGQTIKSSQLATSSLRVYPMIF